MIELPEAVSISHQINEIISGKRIINVTAGQSPHKFAWYFGNPQEYHELLSGKIISKATGYGGLVEIKADDAIILLGDGTNIRYFVEGEKPPKKHQLHIEFEDYSSIYCTVQMYGGLWAFEDGVNDNKYYLVAKEKPSPLSDSFNMDHFNNLLCQCSEKMSLKAFLATEQRIPGLGNGVLQDILFNAGLHPKKKINTLTEADKELLFDSIKMTIAKMTIKGGRDTERDLYGCFGGYKTILSKNTAGRPCHFCGAIIKKEAYMGGSIYYCETCQKI